MKKIKNLLLEVIQTGAPVYNKQTLEIDSSGLVVQKLYPLVYFGQEKVYEYNVAKHDIEQFLDGIDYTKWVVYRKNKPIKWSCKIIFEDDTSIVDSGYRNDLPDENFVNFDSALLSLIPFIEKPWLFTV